MPYREGFCWLLVRPSQAAEPWREAIVRNRNLYPRIYSEMLEAAKEWPELTDSLSRLAKGDIGRELALLGGAWHRDTADFDAELARFREAHPGLADLTPAQRSTVIRLWVSKGGGGSCLVALRKHPEWLTDGWRWIAMHHAEQKEYQLAYETAMRFVPAPALPAFRHLTDSAARGVQRSLTLNREDFALGYQLYDYNLCHGRATEALNMLQKFTKLAACPGYFHYLESVLLGKRQDWQSAWNALQRFSPELRGQQ